MPSLRAIYSLLLVVLLPSPAHAQDASDASCTAAPAANARALLVQAADAVGLDRTPGRVLHMQTMERVVQDFQSERTYPPFFSLMRSAETWFDPATGSERTEATFVYPGTGPNPYPVVLQNHAGAFMARDTTLVPLPTGTTATYALNPWAVLRAWRDAPDVHAAGRCVYRDYVRDVLARPGPHGEERLFLDAKTGFPVKLDLQEPHYLWGQVHVEVLYSLWGDVDGVFLPRAAFRLVDGEVTLERTVGRMAFVARDEAPDLTVPEAPPSDPDAVPVFLQASRPDTVRVGPNAFLLVNRGYTEAVALIDGTVYVFDATQSEERARHDAAWIETLFPGDHPVVVVVTDLAWPHVAGVRYWVSQGATIVSHRMSEPFLRRVAERRWTLEPDALEQHRRDAAFRFVGVDDRHDLADGQVRLAPIDGIGSEGALVAYLPGIRFLWAGDFIQRADAPTAYAAEVWAAVQRAGFAPAYTAAQHLPLTPWATIDALQATGTE